MEKIPGFGLSTSWPLILGADLGSRLIFCDEALEDFLCSLKFPYIEAPLDRFFAPVSLSNRVLRMARCLNESFQIGQNLIEGLLIHGRSIIEVPRKVRFFVRIAAYRCVGISHAAIEERLASAPRF